MKKIDLHTHTVSTASDAAFTFSMTALQEYVKTARIDALGITNHNLFARAQFGQIVGGLDILVLPGIEIDVEKGHLLLLADPQDVDDFENRCFQIEQLMTSGNNYISVQQLRQIFISLDKYLLIPHYDKKPEIGPETLRRLAPHIYAGEVASIRKFKASIKDPTALVPVLFSDTRFTDTLKDFSVRQTYIDTEEISLRTIKAALSDKNKVALSPQDGNKLFEISAGLQLSTGLNIIIGERSSGKTYALDSIHAGVQNAKYIKQFALLQNDEKEFEEKHRIRQADFAEGYLKELKEVVADVSAIDIRQNEKLVEDYLESLKKFGLESAKADHYSKSVLFGETLFEQNRIDTLKKLIEATAQLIDNAEYRPVIDKHIPITGLRALALELITMFRNTMEENAKKNWLNVLMSDIQAELRARTNSTYPEPIDFYNILMERQKVARFCELLSQLKIQKEIERRQIRHFTVIATRRCFTGASQLKAKSKSKNSFRDAFDHYNDPYLFLQCLKAIDIESTDWWKYFVEIDYDVLNENGFPVSGGERSEFKLLHEIKDALKYDLLLIDEPESSFDNLFLKNEVNELIKEISREIPVVISTHNSTVGASIRPDYVLYAEKKLEAGQVIHRIYAGYPSNKELKAPDGKTIANYDCLLNCLEAGEIAYTDRKNKNYEILKD